jgi:hypothetical protein
MLDQHFQTPHQTAPKRLPRRLRQATAEIDVAITPLIEELWRLGFTTRYCCQGDDTAAAPGRAGWQHLAYITFGSLVEAHLFAALAGPFAWDRRTHRRRHSERPDRTDRWTWDWTVEANTVRFPARDIPRATAALSKYRWRLRDVLAPLAAAGAVPATAEGRPPPKTCPACGGVVLSRRKDARYCSRRCQLAGRDRRRPP